MASIYKGWQDIVLTDEELANFYNQNFSLNLQNNEYLLIRNADNQIIDKYCYENNELRPVKWKPISTDLLGTIKPLNVYQELAFDMLQTSHSTLKVFDADFGVGKSFLCANYIFDQLRRGNYRKAILIRPNIGLEDYPSFGYLPGVLHEKMMPWFAMLSDIVGSNQVVEDLIDKEVLELAPLEMLRGRSFNDSIIYVEECGNLTRAACRLIVSRCGQNSIILMCGDQSQADKQKFRDDNGLVVMRDSLKGEALFSYLKWEGCVRSDTARLCERF